MQIRALTRKIIINALQRDLAGDEQIMKEVWEDCYGKDELKVAENELRNVIEHLGQMPWP